MRRLFLLTGALILYGSLFPWRFHPLAPDFDLQTQLQSSWPNELNRWLFKDGLLNVFIYIPFGWLGAEAFHVPRWKSWAIPILCAITLSFGVEYAQLYTAGRVTSAFDFLANVTGGVVGASIANLVRVEWRARDHLRDRPDELLICVLFICSQLFPFVPVRGRTSLYANLSDLANFAWVPFATACVQWLCAGIAAKGLLRTRSVLWLACIMAVKPFVVGRSLSTSEVSAAALALIAVNYSAIPCRAVAAAAAALVLLRESLPMRFSSSVTEFSWIPFQASLGGGEWLRAGGILLDKLFLITTAIWLFRRSGTRLWLATSVMAVVLFGLELVQTHLPGRTPESTDAVLALGGGLLLDIVERHRRAGS